MCTEVPTNSILNGLAILICLVFVLFISVPIITLALIGKIIAVGEGGNSKK